MNWLFMCYVSKYLSSWDHQSYCTDLGHVTLHASMLLAASEVSLPTHNWLLNWVLVIWLFLIIWVSFLLIFIFNFKGANFGGPQLIFLNGLESLNGLCGRCCWSIAAVAINKCHGCCNYWFVIGFNRIKSII